jgi:hypothetical protein
MRKVEFTGRTHSGTGAVDWAWFDVYGRHFDGKAWVVVGMPTAMDGTPLADSARWVAPESVTWGGEKIVMGLLPLVNADGEPAPFPGTVAYGYDADSRPGGKAHAWGYGLSGHASVASPPSPHVARSMDGRTVRVSGTQDASWFIADPNACKVCVRKVKERIKAL